MDQGCDMCGKPINCNNMVGVCSRTITCRRASQNRRQAAHRAGIALREGRTGDAFHERALGMLDGARRRARKRGMSFDLTLDWALAELKQAVECGCPYLGIPIILAGPRNHPGLASIDRFRQEGGYTQDNCLVVSLRANILKRDASLEEIEMLALSVNFFKATRFADLQE